jgi:pimeloyl-ACP methyl ester carboxylesterase
MQLIPWSHTTREGFALRGWHSPPSGKPLLHFLHGNGFCGRTYEPMLAPLSRHFDLWLCDVQGHGDSDHGGRFLGWNRNADLAMEALDAQGGAFRDVPLYGAGHSFGGVLTALILGDQRERFVRAVLLDPVLFTPAMIMGMSVGELTGVVKHTPMARAARARRRHWPSREDAFRQLHGKGVYKGWTDEALHAFLEHALKEAHDGGVELKCKPSREADIFSSAPDRLWGLLGRVRTPTLVLHATKTFPFVTDSVARWRAVNDVVEAQQVQGGHCFMQEKPALAAELVLAYLLPGAALGAALASSPA